MIFGCGDKTFTMFRMFSTRVWQRTGLVIIIGPPGTEKCVVADHVYREARKSGLSAKKSHHNLDKSQLNKEVQIVSLQFYVKPNK